MWSLSPRSSLSGARILQDDTGSTAMKVSHSVTRARQCQEGLGMAGETPGVNLKKTNGNQAAEREKAGGREHSRLKGLQEQEQRT